MGLREVSCGDERPLQEIADLIAGSHKVVLITGAGISTSCGIPDFRSKDGLYNVIPDQDSLPTPPPSQPSTPSLTRVLSEAAFDDNLPASQSSFVSIASRRSTPSSSSRLRGQDLFDARVFQNATSTTTFYRFIASLRQKIRDEVKSTSSVHKFVRVLRDGGRLMRCYTQNIDGLEGREGLVTDLERGKGNKRRFMKKHYEAPRPGHTPGTDFDGGCEVVQLHGDLARLRCTVCATQVEWTDDETDIYLEGAAPKCARCAAKSEVRVASGKRGLAVGTLRPNIVLYGEDHPSNSLLTPLIPFDAGCQPEVLIIMGTSLKVFGLQKIVREFAKAVHARKNGKGRVVFVNRTRPAESVWEGVIDDFVAMDCDAWVDDVKTRRPDLWLRQGELGLAVAKPSQVKRKRKGAADKEIADAPLSKKPRVVVEIPRRAAASMKPPSRMPSTPSRTDGACRWAKSAADHPNRAILSPLAQARRPPVSPLSSPVRPDQEGDGRVAVPGRLLHASPQRPIISPFTPGVLGGSPPQPDCRRDENWPTASDEWRDVASRGCSDDRENTAASTLVSHVWQRFRQGSFFSQYQPFRHLGGTIADEDVIEVETPSRGPRGRKVDVLDQSGNSTVTARLGCRTHPDPIGADREK